MLRFMVSALTSQNTKVPTLGIHFDNWVTVKVIFQTEIPNSFWNEKISLFLFRFQ